MSAGLHPAADRSPASVLGADVAAGHVIKSGRRWYEVRSIDRADPGAAAPWMRSAVVLDTSGMAGPLTVYADTRYPCRPALPGRPGPAAATSDARPLLGLGRHSAPVHADFGQDFPHASLSMGRGAGKSDSAAPRGPGRPAVGPPVPVRLPVALRAALDDARHPGESTAAAARRLLAVALFPGLTGGEPSGPGVRCIGCGALPDEQHREECPERGSGPDVTP